MDKNQTNILLATASLEEIRDMLIVEQKKLFNQIFEEFKEKSKKQKPRQYLTANETCKMLNITRQTLHNWSSNGTLHKLKIQGRIYYKQGDIEKAIEGKSLNFGGENNE